MYLLSQIIFVVSYLFLGATYLTKNRNVLLVSALISNVFFACGYALLDAKTALFINILGLVRQLLLMTSEKIKDNKFYIGIFIFNVISTTLVGVITYEDIYSAIPAFATLIFVYSTWQKDIKMYRLCGMIIELNWLVYGLYIESIVSIVMECILLVNAIVNYIKILNEEKNNKNADSL